MNTNSGLDDIFKNFKDSEAFVQESRSYIP